jgi:DNA-binding LytR/AlgR family response regulator
MINIAVCDNDSSTTNLLESTILNIRNKKDILLDVEIYFDGQALVNDINKGIHYDLIYLEIQMNHKDGIETAVEIRKLDKVTLIVFVSRFENRIKELFQVNTFDFILKPINIVYFENIFIRAYNEIIHGGFYFIYKLNRTYCKVLINDIMYFESRQRKVAIVTVNGIYEYYGKLEQVETYLHNKSADFWRIHQSYLVNYSYIWRMQYNVVVISNGITLNISKDKHKEIRLWGEKEAQAIFKNKITNMCI